MTCKLLKISGAGDRDRTGTQFPARDFKSLASANSATPAGKTFHKNQRLADFMLSRNLTRSQNANPLIEVS
jgi:hypothetical protein